MPLALAFLPLVCLIGLLGYSIIIFGDDVLSGAGQITLLIGACIAFCIGLPFGLSWQKAEKVAVHNIAEAIPSILILLLIGSLTASWVYGGVVPTLVVYGTQIISPSIFLPSACIACAIVSVSTGSSWTTIATVGVALLAVGQGMGFDKPVVAGAVISGAYFGDKLSPLSDTTNLAAAVANTKLFSHIRFMLHTTVPSFVISVLFFFAYGLTVSFEGEAVRATGLDALEHHFNISPITLLVPAITAFFIAKKFDAVPVLVISIAAGVLSGVLTQGDFQPAQAGFYESIIRVLYQGVDIEGVKGILPQGGMDGMLPTIWLVVCAMLFGGMMEASGCLKSITVFVLSKVKGLVSLVGSTLGTAILLNLTTSDQYLSITLTGKVFSNAYESSGTEPLLLSRSIEDGGTVTSVLVPWNTCGAAQASVLQTTTLAYAPFCVFCWVSPIVSLVVTALAKHPPKK